MTATTGGMDELALPDLARRQANTLRVGTVMLCSLPQDAAPPAGDTAEIERTEYPDGTVAEYDHGAHRLLWNLGPTIITADRSSLVLECNGSQIIMDAAGIRLIGARIDLN